MVIKNVKIIEDNSEGEVIKIHDQSLFAGPLNIQDIEGWEDRLKSINAPYILAQFETVVDSESGGLKFARGYGLFLSGNRMEMMGE